MPRIEKMGGTNRLQVSSPVPIRSTGQARMTGEIISDFGDQMMKTSEAVRTIYQKSEEMAAAAQVDAANEQAAVARQKAIIEAENNFKDPMGSDKLTVYQETFANEMRPIIDGIQSPELRARVVQNLGKIRNEGLDTVYRSSVKTREDSIKGMRDSAVGMRIASVNQNPYGVVEAIQKNQASLEATKGVYRADEFAKIAQEEPRILANAAVRALLDNSQFGGKRFEEARRMINGELAPFLGEDAVRLNSEIETKRLSWLDQEDKQQTRIERNAIEAVTERQEETLKLLLLEKTSGDVDPEAYGKRIRDAYMQNEIDARQYEKLNKLNILDGVMAPSNESALLGYNARILSGDVKGLNNQVLADVAAGNTNMEDALRVMSNVSIVNANKNKKDPKFSREYTQGMREVVRALDGPSGSVAPSDAVTLVKITADYGERVARGEAPVKAAQAATREYFSEVKGTTFVAPSLIPMGVQASAQSLKAYQPTFEKNIQKLEQAGDFAQVEKELINYSKRMQALEVLEKEIK